jgi:hypothetical protein
MNPVYNIRIQCSAFQSILNSQEFQIHTCIPGLLMPILQLTPSYPKFALTVNPLEFSFVNNRT